MNEFKGISDQFLSGILHWCVYISWRQQMNHIVFSYYWTSINLLWSLCTPRGTSRTSIRLKALALRRSFQINYSAVCLRCGRIEFLIPTSDIDSDISSESMWGNWGGVGGEEAVKWTMKPLVYQKLFFPSGLISSGGPTLGLFEIPVFGTAEWRSSGNFRSSRFITCSNAWKCVWLHVCMQICIWDADVAYALLSCLQMSPSAQTVSARQ